MARSKAWKPFFDSDHNQIGQGNFGNVDGHHRPRRIARTIVVIALAIGFGYWLNTSYGHHLVEIAQKWLSSARAEPADRAAP